MFSKNRIYTILTLAAAAAAGIGIGILRERTPSATQAPDDRGPREVAQVMIRRAPAAAIPKPSAPLRSVLRAEIRAAEPQPMRGLIQPKNFPNARLVSTAETPPDRDGKFVRIRVLETSMKYPLVRVEERYAHDYGTGENQLVTRVEMVGDHVMLKLEPGYTAEDLARVVAAYGFEIRKAIPAAHLYLVSFNGNDPYALEQAMGQLNGARGVSYSEPDYIGRAN